MSALMTDTQIGAGGRRAVFDGSAWVSADGQYYWDGAKWLPLEKPDARLPLLNLGIGILIVALVGYLAYTTLATESAFTIGFYVGVIAFFGVLLVVFRFAGRWGWFGMVIRGLCVFLAVLKVLSLIAHPPPA